MSTVRPLREPEINTTYLLGRAHKVLNERIRAAQQVGGVDLGLAQTPGG